MGVLHSVKKDTCSLLACLAKGQGLGLAPLHRRSGRGPPTQRALQAAAAGPHPHAAHTSPPRSPDHPQHTGTNTNMVLHSPNPHPLPRQVPPPGLRQRPQRLRGARARALRSHHVSPACARACTRVQLQACTRVHLACMHAGMHAPAVLPCGWLPCQHCCCNHVHSNALLAWANKWHFCPCPPTPLL